MTPSIQQSMLKMQRDKALGNFSLDPMQAYRHNKLIKALFERAKKRAWARLRDHPLVIQLKEEKRRLQVGNNLSLQNTTNIRNFPK